MAQLDQRHFLAALPGLAALPALGQTPALEIIDTHTHFYDPTRPEGVPWPGKDDKVLYRKVLPPEFIELTKPHGVTGTVVVEASPWLKDNDWLLDLAKGNPFLKGIVGRLIPGQENFAKEWDRLAKFDLFKGIRVNADELTKGLGNKAFTQDVARIAESNKTLDLNGSPALLPDVAKLVKLFPKLRIVVNHLANVDIDGKKIPETWIEWIKAISQHEQVYCKISALVEGTRQRNQKAPKELAHYAPTLDVVWKHLGAQRLLYASNWPVSDLFATYAIVFQIVDDYLKTKSKAERANVFGANARKAYRL